MASHSLVVAAASYLSRIVRSAAAYESLLPRNIISALLERKKKLREIGTMTAHNYILLVQHVLIIESSCAVRYIIVLQI